MSVLAALLTADITAPAPASAQDPVSVDPALLDERPTPGGGVTGFVQPSAGSQAWQVRDFAQIGDRIFVAGSFTDANDLPFEGAASYAQSFVAAFDLDTNEVITSFAPVFDDVAWALAVHDGNLIVGGEFDTVNGVAREGLVMLDPITGAIVTSFEASIANVGTIYEGSVRDLKVSGEDLYVVGDFNRLVASGVAHGRYRTARVDATTGAIDSSWIPLVSGGAVFEIEVDELRGQSIMAGTFTSVGALPDTKSGAVVANLDGVVAPGYPVDLNGGFSKSFAAVVDDGRYWLGGEQHYVQIRNADDWSFIGCIATGFDGLDQSDCSADAWRGGSAQGGDFQLAEVLGDDVIILGCHCRGSYFNSISGSTEDLADRGGVRLYASDGTEYDWAPDIRFWNEGPYAAFADTNGCVYVGGDYSGNVDGFARFCNGIGEIQLTGAASEAGVQLSWNEPNEVGQGIERFDVFRDGILLGSTAGLDFLDAVVLGNQDYTYSVLAIATGGSDVVSNDFTVTAAFVDTDGDGQTDDIDDDDDGDGALDVNDAFPLDPNEQLDTDGDGVGDNADVFPADPTEQADNDSDGTGDNADLDDDNDGLVDLAEWGDTIITSPVFSNPGSAVVSNHVVDLSGIGLEIGDPIRVVEIRADGNMVSNLKRFNITVNGNQTSSNVRTGQLCVENLIGTFPAVDITDVAIDVGGGVPGITIDAVTTPQITDVVQCPPLLFEIDIEVFVPIDSDGDGIRDDRDLDSDNDAVPDVIEAGLVDVDNDRRADAGDEGSVAVAPDTDGDGIPDVIDLESGNPLNDGTSFDLVNAGFSELDSSGDGFLSSADLGGGIDANGDGVDDLIDDPLPPFGTPANMTLTTNDIDEVTVSWDPVGGNLKGYLVHRDGQYQVFLGPGVTSWTDTGLTTGEAYLYELRAQATDNSFSAPAPNTISVGAPTLPPFGTPANVVLTTNDVDEVTVTWERVLDAKGYLVHRDNVYLGFVNSTTSSFIDNTVTANTTYEYVVRAQAFDNSFTAPSPVQAIDVGTPQPDTEAPTTPVAAASVTGPGEATVTWDPSTDNVGVTGYLIHREYQFVTWVPAGTTSYVDTGLAGGDTRYRYQVRAQDGAGNNSAPTALIPVIIP